ncbi:MAG: glycosyl transferase [Nitrospinaceae bacterium]|nr:MAG: glycosyl transferase [Nitrospinaceae bacterium]
MLSGFVEAGHEVTACAPENNPEFIEKFTQIGVSFITFPLARNGMNPVKDLYAIAFLVKTLRKIKPEYVFSASMKPVIYGSLAARLAGVPKVFSLISGSGYAFMKTSLKNWLITIVVTSLYRLSLPKNRTVFFQNPDDLSQFVDLKLARKEQAVLVNGSGVDLEYYRPAPLPENGPAFLLICRLIRDKGVVDYVDAARILKKRYPHATFNLLGPFDSNNTSALTKAQIEQWHQEDLIRYCGETEDVRPFISASCVYVLPSYYREGTPRSALEAMAMGRPIITTDAPGCRETVIEGKNGFLVPIKDPQALAEAMERFIVNPDLIQEMGESSRDYAVEKFDAHKVNAKIMKTMGLLNETGKD